MTLPTPDYSLAAETPAEHIRNALQLLGPVERLIADGVPVSDWFVSQRNADAARARLRAALALLEAPR